MIMDMAGGDMIQYRSIMEGSIEDFLFKFKNHMETLRMYKKVNNKYNSKNHKL